MPTVVPSARPCGPDQVTLVPALEGANRSIEAVNRLRPVAAQQARADASHPEDDAAWHAKHDYLSPAQEKLLAEMKAEAEARGAAADVGEGQLDPGGLDEQGHVDPPRADPQAVDGGPVRAGWPAGLRRRRRAVQGATLRARPGRL